MKKLILIALLAMPAMAATKLDECNAIGNLAHEIMKGRQVGVDISKALTIGNNNEFIQNMVLDAYDTPRFSTPEYRRRTEDEFKVKYVTACMKYMKE